MLDKKTKFKPINVEVMRLRVQSLRKENDLTQIQMSEIAGIAKQNYNNFERGRNNQKLSLQQIWCFSQYFGKPLEYFIGADSPAKENKTSDSEIDLMKRENKHLQEKVEILEDNVGLLKDSLAMCREKNNKKEKAG